MRNRNWPNYSLKKFKNVFALLGLLLILIFGIVGGNFIDRTAGRDLTNIEFSPRNLTPDGAHYSVKSLRILGASDEEIIEKLRYQYRNDNFPITNYLLNPDAWEKALIDSRILYPLLSAPFVEILGLNGMYVLPIFSFIFLTLIPLIFQIRYFPDSKYYIAFLLSLSICLSYYMQFNILANTTEGLSLVLISLFFLSIYRDLLSKKRNTVSIITIILAALSCMTRQNEIYILSTLLAVVLSMRKKTYMERFKFVYPVIVIILIWLVISISEFNNYVILRSSTGFTYTEQNFFEVLVQVFETIGLVIVGEILQLWIRDQVLLFLLMISFTICIFGRFNTLIQLQFASTLIAGFVLTTINGSIGTGFRYALPAIIMSIFVITENRWASFMSQEIKR
jgi:hypothetical protein